MKLKHRNNGQLRLEEGSSLGLQLLGSDVVSPTELIPTFRRTALPLSSKVEAKQKTA